jgi:GrpB-like predicted nucleotidyltransferase (UPF0157 family)
MKPRGPGATNDEPIRIVPYDRSWPAAFEQERIILERTLASSVTGGIHHVGSTAVPGLPAKPIIDILVGIEDLESARVHIKPLAALEYVYAPYRSDEMLWFCKPDPAARTHHLRLVATSSERFRDELAFRDHLRHHSECADAYAKLKKELAVRFEHDREAYTEAKTDFVREVSRRARIERRQRPVAELARLAHLAG